MKISELLIEEEEVKAGEFPKLKIGDIDPRNGKKILSAVTDGSGYVVRSRFGDIYNVKYGEPDKKPEPTPAASPTASEPAPAAEPAAEPAVASPVAEPNDITGTDLPPAADDKKPEEKPAEKCGPEVKEKIKQQKTFNAAYKMAKDAGCTDFDWCQIVDVGGGAPSPMPSKDPWYSAPGMGQGSVVTRDGKPTFATPKEEVELDENEFIIPETSEIHRMREIAGTQVVEADKTSTGTPEIKAASKEAAIEIAKKKGIKRFRFCGKYKVQAGKGGRAPSPQPAPAQVPSAAVVGNPMISRQTAPGNPNTRPGSLRDRAAQANAARRPDAPTF